MKCIIGHLLSLLVGGYFIGAGVTKLLGPDKFFKDILNYQLVGEDIAWLAVLYLPWLELIAGLALICTLTRLGAACWIAGMLVVFIVALVYALVRGLNIECGCIGTVSSTVSQSLVIDIVLLAMVAGIAFLARTSHSERQ